VIILKWFVPFIVLLFLAGCSEKPPVVEEISSLCIPPYFEYKSGSCCLDENYNQVCDVEEIQKFPEEEQNVEVPDTCTFGNYFDCSDINIKYDKVSGGSISFDLTFKKFGAAVVTKIDFSQLNCSIENEQWSLGDGVRQTPKSFVVGCPFNADVLDKKFVDSDMVIDIIHYDEVRQGVDSAWSGVYEIKKGTVTGHVSGSI